MISIFRVCRTNVSSTTTTGGEGYDSLGSRGSGTHLVVTHLDALCALVGLRLAHLHLALDGVQVRLLVESLQNSNI